METIHVGRVSSGPWVPQPSDVAQAKKWAKKLVDCSKGRHLPVISQFRRGLHSTFSGSSCFTCPILHPSSPLSLIKGFAGSFLLHPWSSIFYRQLLKLWLWVFQVDRVAHIMFPFDTQANSNFGQGRRQHGNNNKNKTRPQIQHSCHCSKRRK